MEKYYTFEYWAGKLAKWRVVGGDYGKCASVQDAELLGRGYIADGVRWRVVEVVVTRTVVSGDGGDDVPQNNQAD